MLELKNVTKRYGRKVVLDDVSIEFKKGYITCLLGLNGVGKSTTMKSIMRLIPINKGEILVDGEKITQKKVLNTSRSRGVWSSSCEGVGAPPEREIKWEKKGGKRKVKE